MYLDDLEDLSFIYKSMTTIDALEEAVNNMYWIKISTPHLKEGEIDGGQLGDIFRKHTKAMIKEMQEYIEKIKVEGI